MAVGVQFATCSCREETARIWGAAAGGTATLEGSTPHEYGLELPHWAHSTLIPRRAAWRTSLLVAGVLLLATQVTRAQDPAHLTTIVPGGMPGLPVMTGSEVASNGVRVTWFGPSGYYQLYQKFSLTTGTWQPVGGLNLSNQAIVANNHPTAFFRVLGPPPRYTGLQSCEECHAETRDSVIHTAHVGAFTNAVFVGLGGQTNASCLPCHTVGAGLPSGFKNLASSARLAGVQCESCHGPAASHAANPGDLTTIPRVELAATVCGGCHNTQYAPPAVAQYHPPRYEDWNASPHRDVLDELKSDFLSSTNLISTCGRCHSGTVRETFLEGSPLPNAHEAGAIGITCATCHDPHSVNVHTNVLNGVVTNTATGFVLTNRLLGAVYTNQLLNPLASLQNYHTTGNFPTNYNPAINVCAQCHNDRGASTNTTARTPHHSPQYNMLIGGFNTQDTGIPSNQPASHAYIEKQCAACHMQTSAQPARSGHQFQVLTFDACARCHGSAANGEGLAAFLGMIVTSQVQVTKSLLDQWATTKAPPALASYGTRAWEYTEPGELSPGGPGPTTAEQSLIPPAIHKARFNLYLVVNDGSLGVHNPMYILDLLSAAQSNVLQVLNQ